MGVRQEVLLEAWFAHHLLAGGLRLQGGMSCLRATLLLPAEERDRQQGLAFPGLDKNVSLCALNAALLAAAALHLVMNGPEAVGLLALVAKTRPLLNLADSFDVQIQIWSEAFRLPVRHHLKEVEGPGPLSQIALPDQRAGRVVVLVSVERPVGYHNLRKMPPF